MRDAGFWCDELDRVRRTDHIACRKTSGKRCFADHGSDQALVTI